MDTLSVLTTILSIADEIYSAVEEVKQFSERSKRLAGRVRVITQPVRALLDEVEKATITLPSEELAELERQWESDTGAENETEAATDKLKLYLRPLIDLKECIEQIKPFIIKLGETSWLMKVISMSKISRKFEGFNDHLTTLQQSLDLALQVHLGKVIIPDAFSIMKDNMEDLQSEVQKHGQDGEEHMIALTEQIKKLKCQISRGPDLRMKFNEFGDIDLLEEGSFGPIYTAKHEMVEKLLVIKTYNDKSQTARIELKEQLDIWKKLRYSQYIVQLYGYTIDDESRWCFVVEHMAQGTLRSVLQKAENQLPWDERLMLARDCARGLYAIHYCQGERPMLHRAITSTRFLVDRSYTAKICDNGFVKTRSSVARSSAAKPGDLLGDDQNYICPEETSPSYKCSLKSEVYKLGIILYEIASRKTPFQALQEQGKCMTNQDKYVFIKAGKTEDPPEDTPPLLRDLIQACREKDPSDRPNTRNVVSRLENMCEI